jgi:GTP cyclohydrolase III
MSASTAAGSHEDEHQQNSHRGQPEEIEVDSVRVSHMDKSPSAALMTDTMSLGS